MPPVGTEMQGAVEDDRRTMLMRTRSGLHVLCGVACRDFGALVTGPNMAPGGRRSGRGRACRGGEADSADR